MGDSSILLSIECGDFEFVNADNFKQYDEYITFLSGPSIYYNKVMKRSECTG